jgi:nitrogen fixation/metabolism regulation signal transduction histidine kinase
LTLDDKTVGQGYFSRGLNNIYSVVRKAYSELGGKILPPEAIPTTIYNFHQELLNAFWILEEDDERYQLEYNSGFANENEYITFLADPLDIPGFMANIVQNLERAYNKRDAESPEKSHLPRVLRVGYALAEEHFKVTLQDEAVGYDQALLEHGFIEGFSTHEGQGLGMYDYQERFRKLGIKMQLVNHATGASLTVIFPLSAL